MLEQEDAPLALTKKEIVLRARVARPIVEVDHSSIEIYSSLNTYWDILLKHRWLILAVAFACMSLLTIYSFMTKPEYRATARILVEPDNSEVQNVNDLFHTSMSGDEFTFLATQVDVLRSDNLAWQTIQELQLEQTPEFAKNLKQINRNSLDATRSKLLAAFEDRFIVERKRDTRMIEVSFDSTNAQLAARVVNALVKNYIEYNFRMKYDATRQTTSWMEQQLDELKNQVENSQQALVNYERQNSIVNIGNKESVAEQTLADLSHNLTQAQSDRMERESLYQLAASINTKVGVVAQNDLLQKLEERDADLRGQYVDALAQYGEAFPKVVRIRGQIDELQTLIEQERKRTVERLRNDFDASKSREALLTTAVAKQKVMVGNFNQLLIQHNILKREFETNQQLYENLLQRLKDATISAGLRATNIHKVDEAAPTPVPVRPKKLQNSAIGLLAGLILGFLAAMMRESLDNSIQGAEEVERLTGVPALAIIPSQNDLRPHAYKNGHQRSPEEAKGAEGNDALNTPHSLFKKRPALKSGANKVELSVLHNSGSALSESFRALRTAILLSTAEHPPKTLLVTSAHPKEGKTSVSLNLAITLAQKGCRVLILDADFRRPGVTSTLGLLNKRGLSNILSGTETLEKCIGQVDTLENLWVLPTGPCPPHPAELLASPSMGCLLQTICQQFDHVIIDSPPVLLIADTMILSSMVDGVVIVVENEKTSRGAVVRACRVITNSGGRILGAVLNKVDARRDGYSGHYSYQDYYGYADYYSAEASTKRNSDQDSV